MKLILSLPPSYDSLVNRLQLVQQGLTMKLLVNQLLLEDQKRKERTAGEQNAMYSAKFVLRSRQGIPGGQLGGANISNQQGQVEQFCLLQV